MTKIIHIAGHSGSGKTLLAINLALALAARGRDVVLVDANIYSPDVAVSMGLGQCIYLNEFLNGDRKIEETLVNHPSGIRLIPSIAEDEHNPSKHKKINEALLSLVGKSEIVLVDSFSHNQSMFGIIDCADEAIFVAADEFVSITKSKEMIRKMESKGMNIIGVVLNKKIRKGNKLHVESIVEKPVLAEILFEENIIESVNLAKPAFIHYPNSSMAKAAGKLAELLDKQDNGKQR